MIKDNSLSDFDKEGETIFNKLCADGKEMWIKFFLQQQNIPQDFFIKKNINGDNFINLLKKRNSNKAITIILNSTRINVAELIQQTPHYAGLIYESLLPDMSRQT